MENLSNVRIDVNNDSIQVVDDGENHESEESEDYPDDEEVARFFTESLRNKATRTSPQFAADSPKIQTIREPRLGCKKCEYKAKNKAEMNRHTEEKHAEICFKCESCEFQATDHFNLS